MGFSFLMEAETGEESLILMYVWWQMKFLGFDQWLIENPDRENQNHLYQVKISKYEIKSRQTYQ